MILRGFASMGVVAAVVGLLWGAGVSSPAQPLNAAVAAAPAAESPAPGDERSLEEKIAEFIEQARQEIAELRERGRMEEAEALAKEAQGRLDGARELHQKIREVQRQIQELHGQGRLQEAQELQAQAIARLRALKEEGRPEHIAVIESLEGERLRELHAKVERLHEMGRHDEAEALLREHMQGMERRHQKQAEEIARLHEHLEHVHQQMARLHEAGRHEEAEALERRAQEIATRLEHAHQEGYPDVPHWVERMERHAQELRERGELEAAEQVRRELEMRLQQMHREGEMDGPAPVDEFAQWEMRMHHLRAAAENLEAAGMADEARMLWERARDIERQLQARRRPHEEDPPHAEQFEIVMGELHAIRAEVRELTELVRDLHRRLDEMAPRRRD